MYQISQTKLNSVTIYRDKIHSIYYNMHEEYYILYVLAMYYHHGKMTEEKYKGQIKSLRAGNLQKFKGTYHCTLNDRWYDHEPAKTVFREVLEDLDKYCIYLTAEQLIESIMLYSGKNYNYAVNVLYEEYVKIMLEHWSNRASWSDDEFISMYKLNIDYMDIKPVMTHGHYCWECGRSSEEKDSTASFDKGEKELLEYFHTQKRGNLQKIPRYESGSNYMGRW